MSHRGVRRRLWGQAAGCAIVCGTFAALLPGALADENTFTLEDLVRDAAGPVFAADIPWRSAPAPALRLAQTPAEAADTLANLVRTRDTRRVIVQFAAPVTRTQRAALDDAGLTVLAPLGGPAYFATVHEAKLDAGGLAAVANPIERVDTIEREHKQHPLIRNNAIPPFAFVGAPSIDGVAVELVAVYAQFHRDVVLADARALVADFNGTVIDSIDSIGALVVHLPRTELDRFTDHDAVQWVEPPLPMLSTTNDSNRAITGTNTVQSGPYNLDGTGVNVLVYDGGVAMASHNDFGGRLTVRDGANLSDHATHVAGTIGGDGTQSGGTHRGMAPGVTIQSYGFEWDGSDIFLYTNPGDFEDDYDQAINTWGAEISNNSIGSNIEPNGFPCEYQGDYGLMSSLIDAVVGGSLGSPMRIVWAAGNERTGSSCNIEGYGDYYSVPPPSTAKNHLSVGALNSNDDSMTSFSTWGPTDDGRLKPDVSAPGCQSNDDNGVTSASTNGNYSVKCGTSMASPTVCGISALLMEDYKAHYPALPLFRNSTLRAWHAHAAQDRGNTGPDYQFGYGSVRSQAVIDLMRTGAFTEDSVTQGGVVSSTFTVAPGTSEFKVTLAWDDAPGTPNVNPALVNNLDLRVFDPSGTRRYPWTLNPSNPGANAVKNQADTLNNIEQVQVDNPPAGTWTIEVVGTAVPEGPQSFSLVGDGATQIGLGIALPGGAPDVVAPATPLTIDVTINAFGQSIVGGSPTLHYRANGGSFQTSSLTNLGGGNYQANLPGADCGDAPEFYLSAQGSVTGTVTLPGNAPTDTFAYVVGEVGLAFEDDFESNQGWTAENLGASSGDWQRGVPVNDSGWAYDPASDADGSGQCYLTENVDGNTDVDDGSVRLTSPALDLTNLSRIEYDYYLYLTNDDGTDRILVEISANGTSGPWTTIAVHDENGGTSWRHHVITAADVAGAGVTVGSNMRMRFTTNDGDPQSINESGLDGFRVETFGCVSSSSGACCFSDGSCTDGTDGAGCATLGGTYQGDASTCGGVTCAQPGACCFDDGSCTFGFAGDCTSSGGTYQGDNVSCASANCEQPGACCFDDGSCTFGFAGDCTSSGGTYQGDNISCASANCAQPGACCFDDGSCTFGFAGDCTSSGGTYQGDNVTCATASCPAPGACCFATGSCTFVQAGACASAGGTFQGESVSCASANCEQPGACCFDDGSCTFGFAGDCTSSGGTYQGDNVTCATANCPAPGACCFATGSCTFVQAGACASAGGTFQGESVSCASANCEQPGACCFDDGSCTFGFAGDCTSSGGTYQGDNVTCAAASCPAPGACCFATGSCTFVQAGACAAAGGTFQGESVSCASANCEQPGACCFDDGSCTFGFAGDCTSSGGTYQGDNVTCATVSCAQPGACCFDDGSCTVVPSGDCASSGGTYQGDDVSCAAANCAQPGACCFGDGSCTFGFEGDCDVAGGSYQGAGVDCVAANCTQPGACCVDDGSCTFGPEVDCDAIGGSYQGNGVSCASANCEQPGACCFADGSCFEGFAGDCASSGGTYQGDNVTCAAANCAQPGACCFDDGSCSVDSAVACAAAGGAYQGDGIPCGTCAQPGACCLPDGTCRIEDTTGGGVCAADGGSYEGDDTDCGGTDCPQPCLGDLDGSGSVNFPDVLAVLSAWGPCASCPEDLDDSGDVGFNDLLTVLSAWGDCP